MKARIFTSITIRGAIVFWLSLNLFLYNVSFQPEKALAETLSSTMENSSSIEFVGSLGGSVEAVATRNSTAYISEGASLVVLDVSKPHQPVQQSRLPLPDIVSDIQIVDNLAYIANVDSGLQIVDVQDPANPVLMGNYDTPGRASSVVVMDEYAYIADGNYGLQIIDVQEPSAPYWIGGYRAGEYTDRIQFIDDLVYLVDPNQGLYIINAVTPSAPTLQNHILEMRALDIHIVDQFAYLTSNELGLGIFSLDDPTNPVLVNSYRLGLGSAHGVKVKDGLAYVTTFGALVIVDVSDPYEPVELDNLYVGYSPDISIEGSIAYLAIDDGILQIVDVSELTAIMSTGEYVTPGQIFSLLIADQIAYVADLNKGLYIVDISDPSQPHSLSYVENSENAYNLAIENQYLYLANGNMGMQIFDLSTPLSPTLVASFNDNVYNIDFHNELAFVDGLGTFQILDFSDPISPTLRSSYPNIFNTLVVGDLVYGVDDTGFRIIDVSNPDNLQLLGQYTLTTCCKPSSMAISGDFVYLTVEPDEGLQVVDVSDPSTPVLLMSFIDDTGSVKTSDTYLFGAYGIGLERMQIFDISNPARPKPRSTYSLPEMFRDLQIVNDLLFVANGGGGLQILRIDPDNFPPELFLPIIIMNHRD